MQIEAQGAVARMKLSLRNLCNSWGVSLVRKELFLSPKWFIWNTRRKKVFHVRDTFFSVYCLKETSNIL